MQWLDRARAMFRGTYGLSLPDPDRIDVGSVPDTVTLLRAVAAAMPRTAILQLIGPRHHSLRSCLATRALTRRGSTNEYFVALDGDAVSELARVATGCAAHEVCSHLFVQDGEHTLLEAFGRDRGEDLVWLSGGLPSGDIRRFLKVVSGTPPAAERVPRLVAQPRPKVALVR